MYGGPRAAEQQIDGNGHAGSNNPLHVESLCIRVFPFPYYYFAVDLDPYPWVVPPNLAADFPGPGGWNCRRRERRERQDHAKCLAGVKTLAYGFDMSGCESQKDQTCIINDWDSTPGGFWAAQDAFDPTGEDFYDFEESKPLHVPGLETIRMFHVNPKTF